MVTVEPAPSVASSTLASASAVSSSVATASPSSSARAGVNLDEIADAKQTNSMALFEHDLLALCFDASTILGDGRSAKTDPLKLDPAEFGEGATALKKPCAETFPDRLELASCTTTKTMDDSKVELVVRYYSFAGAFGTDKAMRSCLKDNGTWKALDRTSDEFKNAEREARLRKLERALPK